MIDDKKILSSKQIKCNSKNFVSQNSKDNLTHTLLQNLASDTRNHIVNLMLIFLGPNQTRKISLSGNRTQQLLLQTRIWVKLLKLPIEELTILEVSQARLIKLLTKYHGKLRLTDHRGRTLSLSLTDLCSSTTQCCSSS